MATQITADLPTLDFPREVDYPTQEDWAAFSAAAEENFGILGGDWSTQMQLWKTQANAMSTELNTNTTIAQGLANYQGDWTSKAYTLGQTVSVSGVYYICKLTHATGQNPTTGGSLYWNLALGNWSLKVDTNMSGYTSKTTPIDADLIPLSDSSTSFGIKKLTWASMKANLFNGAKSLTANGYIKLPTTMGGLIIQWGSATSSASGQATLTLPIVFPNAILSGSASYFVNALTQNMASIFSSDYSDTSISALVTSAAGAPVVGAQVKFIVIGY